MPDKGPYRVNSSSICLNLYTCVSHDITFRQTKTPAVPIHQQHDVLVKDAKQQLNASMDVIFHVLDDIGVSADT